MSVATHSTLAAPAPRRRRWAARLGFAALTIAAIVVFVSAGNWQRDRMHQKQALRERFDAAAAAQPAPFVELRSEDWPSERYRPVIATGHFDASRQILIDNRVHAGQAGYDVVAPLALDDGRRVLVDRGWVAQGPTRAVLPDEPPPSGEVTVRGRINLTPDRYFELSHATPQGAVWQHLDPRRFAAATGIGVLPVVIEQTAPAAPGDELVRDRPAPDFGIDQHRIYMAQWYAFAALAFALWLFLSVRGARPRATERGDG